MLDSTPENRMAAERWVHPPVPDPVSAPAEAFRFIDCKPRLSSFLEEACAGLAARPKTLDPKFFYDDEGSRLFEQICALPEYYPTRTELAILAAHADDIQEEIGAQPVLIEYGSGNSQKIRLLLDKLQPAAYLAVEIARAQLLSACHALSLLHPRLPITAICADYSQPLQLPVESAAAGRRRVAFFPGSTIGNFSPQAALQFLRQLHRTVGAGGGLLIGVDLKKDAALLDAAYNDSAGVTAAFNLNLLHRMNRELRADFDPASFSHRAFYAPGPGRIEMHLVSRCKQQVHVDDRVFSFDEGESIHTENSYKYTVDEFRALAREAGFGAGKAWVDQQGLFSVHYFSA